MLLHYCRERFNTLRMYLHVHMHYKALTHTHTIIRYYNHHKHTYAHTYTHSLIIIHEDSCKTPTVFWLYFSIFDSFHFVNFLMIVVLQKLQENLGSQTKFHGIKYIYLLYIYSLSLYEHSSYYFALGSP